MSSAFNIQDLSTCEWCGSGVKDTTDMQSHLWQRVLHFTVMSTGKLVIWTPIYEEIKYRKEKKLLSNFER